MQMTPSKFAKIVFPGYLHSGKVDRDDGRIVQNNATRARTIRVGKKRMRRVLDKLEELS